MALMLKNHQIPSKFLGIHTKLACAKRKVISNLHIRITKNEENKFYMYIGIYEKT